MNVNRKLAAVILLLLFVSWLFISCRQKTESEIIAALLADMAVRAEKRDSAALIDNLAADFHDFQGRDLKQTAAMLQEYFSRYRGIVIHVLASRIVIENTRNAAVETDVSLSSGAAQAFRKLIRLRKDGRWLITEVKWEYMALESLFPESLKILRELFPTL
jgi:hypothetical protein